MTSISDLQQWLATLNPNNSVGVDEGGLTLCEIDKSGETTGKEFEIGGFGGEPETTQEGWTIRVSETLPAENSPGWFAVGMFHNGAAECWRCRKPSTGRGARYFWKMPKTEAEAQTIIHRYETKADAIKDAMRIAARDKHAFVFPS